MSISKTICIRFNAYINKSKSEHLIRQSGNHDYGIQLVIYEKVLEESVQVEYSTYLRISLIVIFEARVSEPKEDNMLSTNSLPSSSGVI